MIVAMTLDEAHAAIDDMLLGNKMGNAGERVVIEDFLQGEERALSLWLMAIMYYLWRPVETTNVF